jgi:exonuclease SbcC
VSRHRAALAEQASLAARAQPIEALRIRVGAARRAVPVAVLTPLVLTREATLETAASAHAAATGALAEMLGRSPDDLTAETEALRQAASRFAALVPRADESARLRRELDLCTAESAATEARHHELDSSDITAVIADLGARQEEVRAAQLALPEVRAAIDEARSRLHAHEQVEALTVAHGSAVADLAAATSQALDAKDAWLTVREARIEGMAAELAGALAVGADCPVCGSADHPHLAERHTDAPDAEAERVAQRRVDDANTAQHLHDLKVRELATAIDHARTATGDTSAPELRATLEERRVRARQLAEAVEPGAALEADLAAAVERRRAETAEVQELGKRRAVLEAQRVDLDGRLSVLDRELGAALTDTPYADAGTAHTDTLARLRAVEGTLGAGHDLDEAGRAVAEAHGARTTAALEAGFDSADDAERSLLAPDELTALDHELSGHDARVAAVTALLADPELAELTGVEPPDLTALESVHRAAEAVRALAEAEIAALRRRLERLGTLVADLSDRHDAWDPVRRQLELATHLSAFCEGKATDNRWQIQLSAYVVAWRLSQVADAANLRLATMTHGRYSLEHIDLAGAGERRGGMTLVVRDDWTGVTRDPVTLSGGETFVVALALALGLADVITAEAGGAALQTLFVDEGFGMLDATSLDLVMDTLDSLRESGRTVGVVSHVAEMRSRIPVQVQVHKPHDHGPSTVRLRA